jgi:hypothetical protein
VLAEVAIEAMEIPMVRSCGGRNGVLVAGMIEYRGNPCMVKLKGVGRGVYPNDRYRAIRLE